jgi:pyruvate-formate lyase
MTDDKAFHNDAGPNLSDLAVRIYGFSERFARLDSKHQDYVIQRTEEQHA